MLDDARIHCGLMFMPEDVGTKMRAAHTDLMMTLAVAEADQDLLTRDVTIPQ